MRREAGFSLVEVLAATAVFALVSTLSVGMLSAALRGQEQAEAALERLGAAQRVAALAEADFGQLVMRPVRDAEGFTDPRVFAGSVLGVEQVRGLSEAREIVVLTRTGWTNPETLQPRSTLQRVSWLYDGAALWREAGPYPDAARGPDPVRTLIATGVRDLQLGFFTGAGWADEVRITPGEDGQAGAASPPAAVRIVYTLDGLGRMEHVVLTPAAGAAS
ncbi:MAG: type II secretion system minor pseudopilin GspJ [Oceanicaulis sp.]